MKETYKDINDRIKSLKKLISNYQNEISDMIRQEISEFITPKGFVVSFDKSYRTEGFYNKDKKMMFFFTIYKSHVWITIHSNVDYDGTKYHYKGGSVFKGKWNFKNKNLSQIINII